jgi:hypothetical protein
MTDLRELGDRAATVILDVEDAYARGRGVAGPHPRPLEPLDFVVVAEVVNQVERPITPPVGLVVTRNPSGYHIFSGEVRFADGSARRGALSPGEYVVRVEAPAYQPTEQRINLPGPAASAVISLQPGPGYPFAGVVPFRPPTSGTFDCTAEATPGDLGPTILRGSLLASDGRGRAEATVEVVGAAGPFTVGPTGQWLLLFDGSQPTGKVTVRFGLPRSDGAGGISHDAAGNPILDPVDVAGVCVVRGCQTSLPQTAMRGRVIRASGVGADARVRVGGFPLAAQTRTDGDWSFYFEPGQPATTATVIAVATDGASRSLPNVTIKPLATTDVPTIRLA